MEGIRRRKAHGTRVLVELGGRRIYPNLLQKMARLNSVATIVEYEVEEDGSYRWKLWEWKGAAG